MISGCLLLTLNDNEDFDKLYEGLVWQLSAPDKLRGVGSVRRCYIIKAATPVLVQSVSRMIAYSSAYRYPAFVQIAIIIACDSVYNCKYICLSNFMSCL